ncbi:MAG: AAA family ATPase [Bacteroidales bacterium]|nr:AAA family ATPase [Candidatus Scybalousia scybalohippi]
MKYCLKDIEKQYKVRLDDTQKSVLSSLIDFIESDKHTICLRSSAGTGKSLLMSMLYDIASLNKYDCTFVAPTNKAKLVISNKGDNSRNSTTIHSLLNLRPNLEIEDFDASQLSFDFGFISNKKEYNVLIIDECSMINDELFEVLCKEFSKSKLIFCGDAAQLAPVKQKSISKIFQVETLTMTKIYRQPESKLYPVLERLRKEPIYHFDSVEDENGNIIICDNILLMLKQYSYLFKIGDDFKDNALCKLISYTNKRISALNEIIQKMLFQDDEEYHVGEILTGYDTCKRNNSRIEDSKDYTIKQILPVDMQIEDRHLKSYFIKLFDGEKTFFVNILSKQNSKEDFDFLAKKIESKRQCALHTKKNFNWKLFYELYDKFLTPVDLVYDNRIIKRKSIDYGYCISAHRSQGSSYSIVLIDMENI